ncbi:MAG: hypothetical protein Q4D16_01375 [Eubacteriales bacterium]|nr:hypothetical protein [Eubacteriales bacterium]
MTVQDIIEAGYFELCCEGNTKRLITKAFCCDLLSIAMSRAPENCVWITVMGNKNTLAVASLTDTACIVLAEGVRLSEADMACARQEGITVLQTELPVFDAALKIHRLGLE